MNNYQKALELSGEILENRHAIHHMAETGFNTEQTANYVMERLTQMGYEPTQLIPNSVVATIGKGGKTILLRADMDALPITEETGLEFAAVNGNSHSCGHDVHTAMLLGAARLLKNQEDRLKGTVKFMFQPAEELLSGAKVMVDAGVLENPHVDAALMCHIDSTAPRGIYVSPGPRTTASYNFRITVSGKGCHGAMPETGADPVLTGAHILIGLQEILSREVSFLKGAVLTLGHFKAGSAPNIIPDQAVLEGTMRSYDSATYDHLRARITEVAQSIAAAYRCSAAVETLSAVPVLVNDEKLTADIKRYIGEMADGNFELKDSPPATGSEDFAWISQEVPGCIFGLAAPDEQGEVKYPLHHPKMKLNEEFIPAGSAIFAESAIRWLEENAEN